MSFTRALDLATALQAYAVKQKTSIGGDKTNQVLQQLKLRKGSFDRLFPAMFSLHGLDIKEALNKAILSEDITPNAAKVAEVAINKAMDDIASRYPVLDVQTFNRINSILQAFVDEFNVGGTDSLSKAKVAAMDQQMELLRLEFKQPYIVSYSAGGENRLPSIKIAYNSFSNLRDIVNNRIKEAIVKELAASKITNSNLKDPTFLTTKIINWGHTQADNSIITGKLLAEVMSARNVLKTATSDTDVFKVIVQDFLEQTGQEKTVIKVTQGDLTKGDPQVLSLVLESGIFQTVIVQNRRENQEDLGQLEKKWSLTDAVARNNLLKAMGVDSIRALGNMLLNIKSSPSVIDNYAALLAATLSGEKLPKTGKTINLLDSSVAIKKRRKSVKVVKNSSPALRKDTLVIPTTTVDLNSLLVIINRQLQDVISANMGDGDRRDILNYRTGRLAASAKVESISQSREGMITAFYSYMRNPYATFSEGGRQSIPRSRDPKLLISKSIREIAAEQVGNRLRAIAL